MSCNIESFYNGKVLQPVLGEENILVYYRYDSDKPSKEEHYREISYFLTENHLIKSIAEHHSINIEKWRRDDFLKIEKTYDVKLFNTEEFTSITRIVITTSDEVIEMSPPKESIGEEEMKNFIRFIKKI